MMKIHWFSPCSPERTDIGHYSLRVCEELSRRCDLTLWTHPQHFKGAQQPEWRKRFKAHSYDAVDQHLETLNRADAVFFNIGNNAAFHREILDIMRRVPGVAIMHDRCLFECISSVYLEKPYGELLFTQLIRFTYGKQAAHDYEDWRRGKLSQDYLAEKYPFYEHASLGAWGTLHHSDPAENASSAAKGRFDWTLPLPYPSEPLAETSKLREKDGYLHCVLFGYLGGANRRLAQTLQALSDFPQRERVRLHLAGQIHENLRIEAMLRDLGLGALVKREGFLPERDLDRLLRGCDLVINLRYPTRGEASGSLLRAWNQAVPSVVTNRGIYAQLPDTVAWKIDPKKESEQLIQLWDQLIDNPQLAVEKGLAGRQRLEVLHDVGGYVQGLLDIAATPSVDRGPAITPFLEQRYALFAQQLFRLSPEEVAPILQPIDRELQSWFG